MPRPLRLAPPLLLLLGLWAGEGVADRVLTPSVSDPAVVRPDAEPADAPAEDPGAPAEDPGAPAKDPGAPAEELGVGGEDIGQPAATPAAHSLTRTASDQRRLRAPGVRLPQMLSSKAERLVSGSSQVMPTGIGAQSVSASVSSAGGPAAGALWPSSSDSWAQADARS